MVDKGLSASGGDGRTPPILVIDDEPDFLRTYERVLRRLGYDVITAERGAEGLRIVGSRCLRLVITDLDLPDGDGLSIVAAIRAGTNPPPVIVVSGMPSVAARTAALAAGAAAYLPKPFPIAELAALIQSAAVT
jgi:two-component system KDP operon response regulator KdpE